MIPEMAAKHTPGPWRFVEPSLLPFRIESPDGEYVTQIKYVPSGRAEGETIANARLIAAAPDLLEAVKALQYVLTECDDNYAKWPQWEQAEAAIAKAEGRS